MPSHTEKERKKNNPGLIQRARSFVNEGIGGFKKRESTEALQRSTVQRPFTGAPGQKARRKALIGRGPAPTPTPIIKKTLGQRLPNNPFLPSPIKQELKKKNN